jgi:transposase
MSSAYQSGASQFSPQAEIVLTAFILCKWLVRRLINCAKNWPVKGPISRDRSGCCEATNGPVARSNASIEARSATATPKLGRAIGLRDMLQDILADEDQEAVHWWCKRAKLSRLEPFHELSQSIFKALERRCRLPESASYQWRHRGS